MSKIEVDAIEPQSGTTLTLGASGDTVNIASGATNNLGITEADMFRLTADLVNPANGTISSNLERVDNATFSKIGTGMTESSGVFTFPSTGLYLVKNFSFIQATNDTNTQIQIFVSSDSGSNYDGVSILQAGGASTGELNVSVYQEAFVNVTNASNFRVKFDVGSMTSATVKGDTSRNETAFIFIRLGDSQ
jgi:hypothetical protein